MMPGKRAWTWAIAAATMAVGSAAAQVPPGPPRFADTWAQHQQSQAWAAAKLAKSPLRHEWVDIPFAGKSIHAFVTYPAGHRPAGVVLVVHEVFGLTDSTRNTADEVAQMGYITIAPDMVSGLAPDGGNVEHFPDSRQTSEFITSMTNAAVDARLNAIAAWGLGLPRANGKLGYVGLSWGGGAAFRYAGDPVHDRHLQWVCVFYDVGPPTVTQGPNKADPDRGLLPVTTIDVPVYGFYGSEDKRVMQSLDATGVAMAKAGKFYDPVVYAHADHAFMRVGEDPQNANPANHAAVMASLTRLRQLLRTTLQR